MFKKSDLNDDRTKSVNHSSEQSMLPKKPIRTQTTIGPSIQIKGDVLVNGNEGVRIEGRVEGTISPSDSIVTVGKEGEINATISARAIFVEGTVKGDLKGDERVVVHSSGNVRGNITAPRVTLEDGCKFNGTIDTNVESSAASRSKSPSRSERIADIKLAAGGRSSAISGGGLGKVPD